MSGHALYLGRDWAGPDFDERVKVKGAELRYGVIGKGEPVLCIHGVNIADSLIPPLRHYPQLFEEYQFIGYYRAGYHGSTYEGDAVSIEDGADHAAQLLDHLGIEKAHVLAFSFGGIIGFQMMLSHPERVASAVLLEPYLPRESPQAIQANIDAYMRAIELYQKGDKLAASQRYQEDVCGPRFFAGVDMTEPLDVWEKVEEAADTVFGIDMPAFASWGFKPSQADNLVKSKPTMPVLAAMGLDSEAAMPGFRETQQFLMSWLPQAERAGIPNATHGMQIMNPVAVGEATYAFLQKHPIGKTR